jgi:hypothetical protein
MEVNGCHKFFMKMIEAMDVGHEKITINVKTTTIDLPLKDQKHLDIRLFKFTDDLYTCSDKELKQMDSFIHNIETKYTFRAHNEYSDFKWDTIEYKRRQQPQK